MSRKEVGTQQIVQNQFSDDYGMSVECVDIMAVLENKAGDMDTLYRLKREDLGSCFVPMTDSGSGVYSMSLVLSHFDMSGSKYSGILVVTRCMSNYVLDKKDSSINIVYYHFCSNLLGNILNEHPGLNGYLAKNRKRVYQRSQVRALLKRDLDAGLISKYLYDQYMSFLN
jgi:hypothetical protein